MNSVFNEEILADKLSKLINTHQFIETLSQWCIFHRSKAKQVVATWDKQFHSSEMVKKVHLLYLAHDILKNSMENGNEFVSKFWNVLPSALKDVVKHGDDRGKKAVSRLVNRWEERKIFGSYAESLKDAMLGEELPSSLDFGKKRSRSIIIEGDSRSIKTKLTIGSTEEKIVSAFNSVVSEHPIENEEINKCKSAVQRVSKIGEDVKVSLTKAKDSTRKTIVKELEKEELVLIQCIEKLKVVEASRVILISQLQDALYEQKSELENVRMQMQVAQVQAEEAANMLKRLNEDHITDSKASMASADTNTNPAQKTEKATAAKLADKLAASSSSQYILTSVLSAFAGEEAKNAGLVKSSSPSTPFSSVFNTPMAANMRKHLNEDHITDSKEFIASADTNTKPAQRTEKAAAVVAAELTDKLATSRLSQYIFTSILSEYAAEEAKNAGLVKSSSPLTSFSSVSNTPMLKPVSDQNVSMPAQQPNPPQNNPFQSHMVPRPSIKGQISYSPYLCQSLPKPPSQRYLQPPGGIVASYDYGNFLQLPPRPPPPPLPPPPPPSPPSLTAPEPPLPPPLPFYMLSPTVPFA
ncbi:regulation of nuclear pre-mRNA domain-containing protein 2-like [Olea europaea var. sylvestris]|uniref:regulation of nuclear pre-mRNA domain-containing protein 2-like n=1 Tax=Olea europaea var. sylvestris TaxID=158386 RepID=UPI000C1CFFB9|nr:regulation of nuclear pre-mRNA domain-containing protein 2-like [Olea europaea var. sylvestris]